GLGDHIRADRTGRAFAVLHDHRLVPLLAQAVRDDASEDIGGRARRVADDDAHRLRRILVLRRGGDRDRERRHERGDDAVEPSGEAVAQAHAHLRRVGADTARVRESRSRRWSGSDSFFSGRDWGSRAWLTASRRTSEGLLPKASRKRREKCEPSANPVSSATSEIGWRVSTTRSYARRRRKVRASSEGPIPSSALKSRSRCRGLTCSSRAMSRTVTRAPALRSMYSIAR